MGWPRPPAAGERVLSQEPDGWHFTFRGGGAQSQAEYLRSELGGWTLDREYCLGPEGEQGELKHGLLVEPECYCKEHPGAPRHI